MEKMNVSQALKRISKLKGTLNKLHDRAAASVVYDKDQPPAFSFSESVQAADKAIVELTALKTALRVTNALTVFDYGATKMTLAQATVLVEEHKSRIAWLSTLATQPHPEKRTSRMAWDDEGNKQYKVEQVFVCALPEAERAQAIDETQQALDSLNEAIDATNYATMLHTV